MNRYYRNFYNNIFPEPNTGCWLWAGPLDEGYGICNIKSLRRAHRVSYLIHKGSFDTCLHVLHSCDVRSCVNPDHLFLGTNLDNIKDRVRKKRTVALCGEKSHKSKISETTARQIFNDRQSGMSYKDIMIKHRTTRNVVVFVSTGLSWQHLNLLKRK